MNDLRNYWRQRSARAAQRLANEALERELERFLRQEGVGATVLPTEPQAASARAGLLGTDLQGVPVTEPWRVEWRLPLRRSLPNFL